MSRHDRRGITRRTFLALSGAAPALLESTVKAQTGGVALRLFGHRFTFANGAWSGPRLPGLKPLPKPDTRPFRIDYVGDIPSGTLDMQADFDASIVDGELRLGRTSDRASIKADRWGYQGPNHFNPGKPVAIVTDDFVGDAGVGFVLPSFSLADALAFANPIFGESVQPDIGPMDPPVVLTVDLATGRFAAMPPGGKPRHFLDMIDSFRSAGGVGGARELMQPFAFRRLTWSWSEKVATAELEPEEGGWLIHPDILDPSRPAKGWNNILYQFALANGVLTATQHRLGNISGVRWRWNGVDGKPAALIAYRYLDENGNPIVLEASGFDVVRRIGTTKQTRATKGADPNEERTLAAAVIAHDTKTECRIRSIDPRRVSQKVSQQRAWPPYWVTRGDTDGRLSVPLSRAPREIHGVNRDAFFQCRASDPNAIHAVITTHPVMQSVPGESVPNLLFVLTQLDLKAADWLFLSHFESADFYARASATPPPDGPALRHAKPLSLVKDTLSVPLIDTSYAIANLGPGRQQATIAKEAGAWLTDLNRDLADNARYTIQKPHQTTHVTGYEYDPQSAFFDTILDPPLARACRRDTLPRGIRMQAGKPAYLHGGSRGDGTLEEVQKSLDGDPAKKFSAGYAKFEKFWQGDASLSTDDLLRRETLRAYLNPEVELVASDLFLKSLWDPETFKDLQRVFGDAFASIQAMFPKNDVVKTRELWQWTAEKIKLPPLLWSAFRAAVQQRWAENNRFTEKDGKRVADMEFFARAAAQAVDVVHNFASKVDERFATLRDVIPGDLAVETLIELWTHPPTAVDAVLWKVFCEYLESPPMPGTYRRALQAVYGTPATSEGYDDEFAEIFSTTILVRIGDQPSFTITPAKAISLQTLAGLINEKVHGSTVRAFTQRLTDNKTHLLFDTQGPTHVSIIINGEEQLAPAVLELQAARAELQKNVERFQERFDDYFDSLVGGFLTRGREGVDALMAKLETMWRSPVDVPDWNDAERQGLEELRRRFGPLMTPDVYRDLLADPDTTANGARAVITRLFNKAISIPPANAVINTLKEIPSEPPSYLFITKRFPVRETVPVPESDFMWRRNFELCKFGSNGWSFFLDGDSSVVVKLARDKSLPEILEEIHAQYFDPDTRTNPLGLRAPRIEGVREFVSGLHDDLKERSWVGVMIIQPTADISSDAQLADVCGFQHITADYVALGGAKLELENLDVYARIHREADPRGSEVDADVALTLVKFDATIRHTRIESGEILLNFKPKNVWGNKTEFKALTIRGTLARDQKTEGSEQASSFEFAAIFDNPERLNVNLAFVDSVLLRAIRVGRARGQTSLNIDGDLKTKDFSWKTPPDEYKVPEGDTFSLRNFRILLPSASGKAVAMGLPRMLDFEFPSVTFEVPHARSFCVNFLDFKLTGIGFIRDLNIRNNFRDRYEWIKGGDQNFDQGKYLSFLRFEVSFGQLPLLGGASVGDLKLEVVLAVLLDGSVLSTRMGIGSFDAKKISIDLFRFLTLEIEELFVQEREVGRLDTNKVKATVIGATNARVKILDWPLFGENGALSVRLIHTDKDRASFIFHHKELPDPHDHNQKTKDDPFFELHWALLANGINFPPELLTELMEPSDPPTTSADASGFVKGLEPQDGKRIYADLLPSSSWLFGASFSLGKIIPNGAFILHDQHYYGISLASEWLSKLIGAERLTLAYIVGASRELDKFRTTFRLEALNFIADMRSGEIALEWGPSWNFLVDIGFPWRAAGGYLWERAFSVPVDIYEAKFGFFIQKDAVAAKRPRADLVQLSAGVGFYIGYFVGRTAGPAWVRAGIGVFAIYQGTIIFKPEGGIPGSLVELTVTGVTGIYAYGEGGVEVWILSARFAVSAQAAIATTLHYVVGGNCTLSYEALLGARYSASVRVGSGPFAWTFSVSGSLDIPVSGRLALT